MKTIDINKIKLSINDENEICKLHHCIRVYEDIKARGIKYPIILNRDGIILRGTLRYAIARELGIKKLPYLVKGVDDEREVRQYERLFSHPVGDYT